MQRPALYNGIVVLIKKNCSLFINDAKIMINTFGQTIARSFFLLCIHSSEINLFKRSTRGDKKFTKFQNEISARAIVSNDRHSSRRKCKEVMRLRSRNNRRIFPVAKYYLAPTRLERERWN